MRFGFPGDNLHLENHGVSEESFWPSFTDIMMVIVMVFLLVTVSVLLNNLALNSDLKQSISAQKVASSLVESKKQENQDLAIKLNALTAQFATVENEKKAEVQKLSEALLQLATSQSNADNLTQKLSVANSANTDKAVEIKNLEEQVSAQANSLSASKELADKLIANLAAVTKSKDEKSQELTRLNSLLSENEEEKTRLTQALKEKDSELTLSQKSEKALTAERDASIEESKSQLAKVTTLEKNISELKVALTTLQENRGDSASKFDALNLKHQELLIDLEAALKEKEKQTAHVATLKKSKAAMKDILTTLQADRGSVADKLLKLQNQLTIANEEKERANEEKESTDEQESNKDKKIKELLASAKQQTARIENLEEENKRLSGDIVNKLTDTEQDLEALKIQTKELETQLESKDLAITALQKERTTTETQLLSLKGEFDTLDTKYQKLLQPARSSKGKFVVSVVYKKSGAKRVIRLKSSPKGSYKTVKKAELYKRLSSLKKKHKTDLYIKVIIPKNSNLSHNDAWKFTTNLQQKYDYYFQPDKSK